MQHRFDVFHADAHDQDVRRAVVTHGHHHRGQVTERQARYSGVRPSIMSLPLRRSSLRTKYSSVSLSLGKRRRKRFIIACVQVDLAAWRKGK